MWRDRDLTDEEGAAQLQLDLRLASQLGFTSIRPKFGVTSLELDPHPIWAGAVERSLDLAAELDVVICPEIHSPDADQAPGHPGLPRVHRADRHRALQAAHRHRHLPDRAGRRRRRGPRHRRGQEAARVPAAAGRADGRPGRGPAARALHPDQVLRDRRRAERPARAVGPIMAALQEAAGTAGCPASTRDGGSRTAAATRSAASTPCCGPSKPARDRDQAQHRPGQVSATAGALPPH